MGLCGIDFKPAKPLDGLNLTGIIKGGEKVFDRYIISRQANQPVGKCNSSIRNERFRLVLTMSDTLLYDMQNDPDQKTNIADSEPALKMILIAELDKINSQLVSEYRPVTTIEAGFPEEKKFTLPVQDATLSGHVKFSSIHPNQSHTEQWIQNNDSIFWILNINTGGKYRVEMQYGCPAGETGSKMKFCSESGSVFFTIDQPFESEVLPQRDYVKRSESVERTWAWMEIGTINLEPGPEKLVIKLLEKKNNEAALIKAIRLIKQ
jgi:hypothetical protein